MDYQFDQLYLLYKSQNLDLELGYIVQKPYWTKGQQLKVHFESFLTSQS